MARWLLTVFADKCSASFLLNVQGGDVRQTADPERRDQVVPEDGGFRALLGRLVVRDDVYAHPSVDELSEQRRLSFCGQDVLALGESFSERRLVRERARSRVLRTSKTVSPIPESEVHPPRTAELTRTHN
jgi:hypothetical protein